MLSPGQIGYLRPVGDVGFRREEIRYVQCQTVGHVYAGIDQILRHGGSGYPMRITSIDIDRGIGRIPLERCNGVFE